MPFDLKKIVDEQQVKQPYEFFVKDRFKDTVKKDDREKQADFPEAKPERDAGEILYSWQAPEFEVYEKSRNWYIIATLFLFVVIIYAILTNGPIMAVTFILIGIVGYIYAQKEPRTIKFSITSKGLLADNNFYPYENIFSFWIFYEPTHTKVISLHTKAPVLPFVHIPIENEEPVKLRELLMQNIPEIKQQPSLINTIERVLHI